MNCKETDYFYYVYLRWEPDPVKCLRWSGGISLIAGMVIVCSYDNRLIIMTSYISCQKMLITGLYLGEWATFT